MSSRSDRIVARSPSRPPAAQSDDSPMMEQFWRAKKEAPDALLFFRMGDFYELFHEDAIVASRALGLTLTSRSKGSPQPIPMAGVPVRAADAYLVRLVKLGHKVAICEQLQDPREAKGIVERGIVRVVTPGTLTEENALDARASNYLASLVLVDGRAGLAWVELSTGRMQGCEIDEARVLDELARLSPAELLLAPEVLQQHPDWKTELEEHLGVALSEREAWRFATDGALRALTRHFRVKSLEGFGVEPESLLVPAAGALPYRLNGRCVGQELIGNAEHLKEVAHLRQFHPLQRDESNGRLRVLGELRNAP